MTPSPSTPSPLRPAAPVAPWAGPRVVGVAVARPAVDVDPASCGAIEWLPRFGADRRL